MLDFEPQKFVLSTLYGNGQFRKSSLQLITINVNKNNGLN